MTLLVALGTISLAELMLYFGPVWRRRRLLATVLTVMLAICTGMIILQKFSLVTVLVVIFSLYRIVNLGRAVEDRIQADYLFHTARRTSLWLIGWQGLILLLAMLSDYFTAPAMSWWYVLAVAQALAALVLLGSTTRHLRTTMPPPLAATVPDHDLPSLTVAIPARNETTDLETCLQSLIASTYPKLEILVLDDCSQNKHTPEIIRSFAHDGVRFIAGTPPPDKWLAKNYAYAQLASEANGALLLFCGVDARFEPSSLSALVRTLLQKKKSMISVLPRNTAPRSWNLLSAMLQPNRYAWELTLPRRLLQRPPVLSSCWLITRQALQAAGGLAAVSRKAVPESYFARTTANSSDGYSFLQSDNTIGISSQKSFGEQRATAVRTRYPQLHRRPELTVLVALLEFSVLLGPLILLIAALLNRQWVLAAISGLSYLMVTVAYSKVVTLTYRQFLLRGSWLLPLAAMYDIGLLNYSMWQYEFREVVWKGRNICIPVMRVLPRLPRA